MGPMAYIQHLLSGNRLPFTAAYFGSIFMTIYFSMGVSTTINCCSYRDHIAHVVIASKLLLDPHCCYRTDCCLDMVSGQLFPHGFKRPAPRHLIRCPASCCLGDRLICLCLGIVSVYSICTIQESLKCISTLTVSNEYKCRSHIL